MVRFTSGYSLCIKRTEYSQAYFYHQILKNFGRRREPVEKANLMESNRNPFRYDSDFDLNDIVGRKEEILLAELAIRDGQRLFLSGPRGFGKTSILRAAQANMSREGAIVLYVNAGASSDIAKLVEEIIAGVASQVFEGEKDGIAKACQALFHMEAASKFPADGQDMPVRVDIDTLSDRYMQIEVLTTTLNSLNSLASSLPESRPLALIIDEFSVLMKRFGVMAERQIRSVVQRHQNVGYIFSGSDVGLMMDMTAKHSRPFYHGGDHLYLRPVPAADFATWLYEHFTECGFEVSGNDPILCILSLADDVPYCVQMLAHNCWEQLHHGEKSKLTVGLVETVLEQTVKSLDASLRERWNGLANLQRKTLIAVLDANGQRIKPVEIARSIASPASSARSAVRALYDRGILWDDWNLGKLRVRLEDPFFGHWIRMNE
jgi:energy-coupling factor transporter ATP-binding protein EcfA2